MQAEQLRPLDAAYLALDGPRTVGHVCLMLPLDGAVTFSELLAQVRSGDRETESASKVTGSAIMCA